MGSGSHIVPIPWVLLAVGCSQCTAWAWGAVGCLERAVLLEVLGVRLQVTA